MNKAEQFNLPLPAAPTTIPIDIRKGWTSASNARADALCAGRHQAQKGLPDIDTEDAAYGRGIHNALATGDTKGLDEGQLQTHDLCNEVELVVRKQFFGDEESDLLVRNEERFWVKIPNPDGKTFHMHSGQVDRVYRSKTKALVIEYKTLPGDVPSASNNPQLQDQVVLVQGGLLVETVGCVVIQPLVTMKPEICVYNRLQIKAAEGAMFKRVVESNTPGARRTAGKVQCDFCKAKSKCEVYEKFASESLPVMQSFIDSPVDTWTPEQCLVFLERRGTAQKWLDETESAIRKRVEAGEIPGWKIGEGSRNGKITDMLALVERCRALGIPDDQLISICTPGKEKLQSLVRAATKTKGKGLMAEVEKLLDGLQTDDRKRGSLERSDA